MKPEDTRAELERKLDASIKEAEALLAASGQREGGEKLDTSRIKKVASDMQAQARDFSNRVEEAKRKLDAVSERQRKPRSATVGRDMIMYLVGVMIMFLIFYFAGK